MSANVSVFLKCLNNISLQSCPEFFLALERKVVSLKICLPDGLMT